MRFVPGLEAMMGPPRGVVERNARARGLLLTVGVALDATEPGPAADEARDLAAHGIAHLWFGLGRSPGRTTAACAAAAADAVPWLPVLAATGGLVDQVGASAAEARSWLAGGRDVAVPAAEAGRCWLAVGCDPPAVLQGVVEAEEADGGLPADGVAVLLTAGMRRGDLAPGEPGATNATALRTLMERYVAVGASWFVLRPVGADLHRWLHDICLPVSDLEQEGRAPCGC